MKKESSIKTSIMSIRMTEEDRARIDKIRRYLFEETSTLWSASEIIRALICAKASLIDEEKGGEDNG